VHVCLSVGLFFSDYIVLLIKSCTLPRLRLHVLRKKNTHSDFLVYRIEKCSDLYEIFRESL